MYKQGYVVRVTSWENDMDHWNTREMSGLSEPEMREIVSFAQAFVEWGNIYDATDEQAEKVEAALQKAVPEYTDVWALAYDLGLTSREYFTRQCERVEVWYIEEDVKCHKVEFDA